MKARATACANVALVKYFGKRDAAYNLPAAPSLSLTLAELRTTTTVEFVPGMPDAVFLDGAAAPAPFAERVSRFVDLVRPAGCGARIETENNFPTAAGLASSASGFAALAAAASRAAGLHLDDAALSALARRGSGSAARSVCGGIAVWEAGTRSDGSDSVAHTIDPATDWPVRMVVGIASRAPKELGSTQAMNRTRDTSPYYGPFIAATAGWVDEARAAVAARDFEALGAVTERSALAMHAAAMAADPPIVYLHPTTMAALHAVRALRSDGVPAYFTCDAGPQPKVLCLAESARRVADTLGDIPGIQRTITCTPGPGVQVALLAD